MRYRLIRRGSRGEKFYCVDTLTGRRSSLQTPIEDEARQIVHARNQALRQPALNLQIAKAYLAGSDSGVAMRKGEIDLTEWRMVQWELLDRGELHLVRQTVPKPRARQVSQES